MEGAHVEVVETAVGEDAHADEQIWRREAAHQVVRRRLQLPPITFQIIITNSKTDLFIKILQVLY